MPRSVAALIVSVFLAGLAAGCGGSSKKSTTTSSTPTTPAAKAPEIVTFKGPSAVPCQKKGQIKTVSFRYETRNATAVEPEIDGQAPGAQAGYDPAGGTMRFEYKCLGPHRLTITAFGKGGKQASKTATVGPEGPS
jgi:hypothetical protein